MNPEKIIFSIDVSDVQTVAEESFGRQLTESELNTIAQNIINHFNWFRSVENAIAKELKIPKTQDEDADDYAF